MPKYTLAELLSQCTPQNRHEEVFVDERQASPDINDLLANLARRVQSLEQQLRDTQHNLETFAEQTEINTQDIVMLDERTQPQSVEVVTFEKFLDSVTDEVAKKLAEKVVSDLRTEMRLKALRGF